MAELAGSKPVGMYRIVGGPLDRVGGEVFVGWFADESWMEYV